MCMVSATPVSKFVIRDRKFPIHIIPTLNWVYNVSVGITNLCLHELCNCLFCECSSYTICQIIVED